MGSDRARRTYDEKRKYRRVIAQQGRAIIEADINEAQENATEESREEILDVVGPVGTPDGGYEVKASSTAHDLTISQGTMYVGGMRVTLDDDITSLSDQKEWLDAGLWPYNTHELIYLLVTEQEVSAVEDSTLREVALGGPDTAQRSRLVQGIDRFTLSANDKECADAMAAYKASVAEGGLIFDAPGTPQQLTAGCKLKVDFPVLPAPDACAPAPSSSGYLGAENQLLRVQISGEGKFVWAFDDASSLYRITASNPTPTATVFKVASRPVDAQHEPAPHQMAELLRARVDLGDGDYIAAPTGEVIEIQSYDRDQGIITLASDMPAQYLADAVAGRLFVRIWQDEASFTSGVAVDIGTTGIAVTLSDGPFPVGAYWTMALRPAAPDLVFPKRYTEAPQPPEGPRQWVCPLAVVHWSDEVADIKDCRKRFDDLVVLTTRTRARYDFVLDPKVVAGGSKLQSWLDAIAAAKAPGEKIFIGVNPGYYKLLAPLQLGYPYSDFVFEGNREAVFMAAEGASASFADGLVVVTNATNLELRGLTFSMKSADFEAAGGTLAGFSPTSLYNASAQAIDLRNLSTAVGLRVYGGSVAVRDCVFDYSGVVAPTNGGGLFAAGVFANGPVQALSVERSDFAFNQSITSEKMQVFGIVHSPSSIVMDIPGCRTVGALEARLSLGFIRDSYFSGLRAAALIQVAPERLQVHTNVAEACYAGFVVVPHWAMATTEATLTQRLSGLDSRVDRSAGGSAESDVSSKILGLLDDPMLSAGGAIARAYPSAANVTIPTTSLIDPAPLASLNGLLTTIEAAALSAPPAATTAVPNIIGVTSNRVVCSADAAGTATGGRGAALVVWDAAWDVEGARQTSVVLGSNWMGGAGSFAPATLLGVQRCTASGNTVQSLADDPSASYSMVVVPPAATAEVAVMGNTFSAMTVLPTRTSSGTDLAVSSTFFNQYVTAATGGETSTRGVREIYFDAEQTSPIISQRERSGSGDNDGATLLIKGQQGQSVAGLIDRTNNDGGDVHIDGGDAGTGAMVGGKQGAVRLASNGITLGVWLSGVEVELGPTTTPLGGGSGDLAAKSVPARWLSSGSEVFRLACAKRPDDPNTGAPGQSVALLQPAAVFQLSDDAETAVFSMDPTWAFHFKGKPVVLGQTPLMYQGSSVEPVGTTATIDLTKGCLHSLTLAADTTIELAAPTDVGAATRFELHLHEGLNGSGGPWAVTWSSAFSFASGTSDATPGATGLTIYEFTVDDGGHAYCINVKKFG